MRRFPFTFNFKFKFLCTFKQFKVGLSYNKNKTSQMRQQTVIINSALPEVKVTLPEKLTNVSSITVRSVEIPMSFYTVSSYNDQVIVVDSSAVSRTATLIHGSYNASDFIVELDRALNATAHGGLFASTFDDKTLKITTTNATSFYFDATSTGKKLIGLVDASPTAVATSWTSADVIDLNRTNSAWLLSDALTRGSNAVIRGGATSVELYGGCFHRVFLSEDFGSIVRDKPSSFSQYTYEQGDSTNLSEIDIRLVDDDGNDLDLNGLEYEVELCVRYCSS